MHFYMGKCLGLAAKGRRLVGNGAMVGAVLVRDGNIIAEGYHQEFGAAHAERSLLQNFDQDIQQEDVLFVNLEPCSHQGKTPPCTDVILSKGVNTVVYGMDDPDQRVHGKGIELLRQHGVRVIGPVQRTLCERLNRGFMTVRTQSRPWITLKMATTRAGKIAEPDGKPLKITSEAQDAWSHQSLRSQADGIIVGVGTILADNPKLTVRFSKKEKSHSALGEEESTKNKKFDQSQPWRIVLDSQLRTPDTATVVTDEYRMNTILITSADSISRQNDKIDSLNKKGVLIFPVAYEENMFVWEELWSALLTPVDDYPGLTSVLVEGGQKTWDVFKKAGVVDEEVRLVGKM